MVTRLVGLTGKPNVGKSTLYSALTLNIVKIADYPFTTLTPNRGVGYLRKKCVCKSLNVTDNPVNSKCINGFRFIPVELVDLPGIVPGAHEGRGLGNQFLSEISIADALIHVVDASGSLDAEGRPVDPDPENTIRDIRFLEEEYDHWLAGIIERGLQKVPRTKPSRASVEESLSHVLSGLAISRRHVEEAIEKVNPPDNIYQWSKNTILELAKNIRMIAKPMVIAANKIDKKGAEEGVRKMREAGYDPIPISAEAELVLRKATEAGLVEYLPGDSDFRIVNPNALSKKQLEALEMVRDRVLKPWGSTGVQELLNRVYFNVLNMITVYPVEDANKLTDKKGNVLPDVYLVPRGMSVREFAGLIHTELMENFLYAIDAKSKIRLGEDYVLKDDDVVSIIAVGRRG
ncbi:MAG: redox-regulated ATPase YchF [Candidatus Brockarchaeota archaeon]|nr:redox-regulated ATPase YchF [Candidatus Brockarchaeota archaeon]